MNYSEQELVLKKELESQLKKYLKKNENWKALEVIQKADKECIILDENVFIHSNIPIFLQSLIYNFQDVSNYIISNYEKPQTKSLDDVFNPMTSAIREGRLEIIEALEKKGFGLNDLIKEGNSAFMLACNPYPKMSLETGGLKFILNQMKPNLLIRNKKGQNAFDILESKAPDEKQLLTLMKEKTLEQQEIQKIKDEQKMLEKNINSNSHNISTVNKLKI
jgi:hypothetical protein